jgi:hypothetical protein
MVGDVETAMVGSNVGISGARKKTGPIRLMFEKRFAAHGYLKTAAMFDQLHDLPCVRCLERLVDIDAGVAAVIARHPTHDARKITMRQV